VLKEAPRNGKRKTPGRRSKKAVDASNSRHAKQREHILRHAAKAFAESGYAVTTMDVLSEVTEMNKASLYYYFGSKRQPRYRRHYGCSINNALGILVVHPTELAASWLRRS